MDGPGAGWLEAGVPAIVYSEAGGFEADGFGANRFGGGWVVAGSEATCRKCLCNIWARVVVGSLMAFPKPTGGSQPDTLGVG